MIASTSSPTDNQKRAGDKHFFASREAHAKFNPCGNGPRIQDNARGEFRAKHHTPPLTHMFEARFMVGPFSYAFYKWSMFDSPATDGEQALSTPRYARQPRTNPPSMGPIVQPCNIFVSTGRAPARSPVDARAVCNDTGRAIPSVIFSLLTSFLLQ